MSISQKANLYKSRIIEEKDSLLAILLQVESISTAEDEIQRAIKCFDEICIQKPYLSAGQVEAIASFLPINQPLYSFILYVVVPSMTAKRVHFRPPLILWKMFEALFQIFIDISENIYMVQICRRDFIEKYAMHSNVVIFTGEYDNALKVLKKLSRDVLFIFNGSALNPIIITETAVIDHAVTTVVRERLFNSGQDCMAPSSILVSKKIAEDFIERVIKRLQKERTGLNLDRNATIGQMVDLDSIEFVKGAIEKYPEYLIFGGKYDSKLKLIEPTVFLFNCVELVPQQIYFAPVFFIGLFDCIEEVEAFLSTDTAQTLKGYISLFADERFSWDWEKNKENQVLRNEGLFVFESANREFGGYGRGCSFLSINDKLQSKPILISKEIYRSFY